MSERAMLSDGAARELKFEALGIVNSDSWSCHMMGLAAHCEAARILAETQACRCAGGWHWTPERGYWQCEGVAEPNILRIGEDPAAALADALAAFVGDTQ